MSGRLTSTPIVAFRGVQVQFHSEERATLDVADLQISSGQFVAVVGPSGSGKSTLLRLIAGLLEPSEGTVLTGGERADSAMCRLGFVFQEPTLLPWRTGVQNIKLPSQLGPSPKDVSDAEIHDILRLVGLSEQDAGKRPAELSGGMRMRISLARALITNPQLLLMDEPFAALDDMLRQQLQVDVRLIHERQRLTTVFVTHNISEAVFMSDHILVLGDQPARIVADIDNSRMAQRDYTLRGTTEYHAAIRTVTDAIQTHAIESAER